MKGSDVAQGTTRAPASPHRRLWSTIPPPNRRWIVVNALAVTAAINIVVNLAIAWLGTRGVHSVALWSTPLRRPSTIADTLATTFMLPLITAITTGIALRREIQTGTILPLPLDCEARHLLNRLPHSLLGRAMRIALLTLAAIGPITVLLLIAGQFDNVSVPSFLVFKVAYAVGLGLMVTPVVALAAMTHEAPSLTRRPQD